MTWLPTLTGQPIDILVPQAVEVDFPALAHAMARLNRFNGHAQTVVSVGLHTLIGLVIAPEAIRPWWLLHDAHETRTGEVATPVKDALDTLARERFGPVVAEQIRQVRETLEDRHDAAIHAAAGLEMPTAAQRAEIKRIDLVALATEKRDFLAPCPRPWWIDGAGITAHPLKRRWLAPDKVTDQLVEAFDRYLPACRAAAGRTLL